MDMRVNILLKLWIEVPYIEVIILMPTSIVSIYDCFTTNPKRFEVICGSKYFKEKVIYKAGEY
jgi:hypothetical protein